MHPVGSPRARFLSTATPRDAAPPESAGWQAHGSAWSLTLDGEPPGSRLFVWDSLVLLLRGVVRLRGKKHEALDVEAVAAAIHADYVESGRLAVERLGGAFHLVLLDAAAERVLAYRNYAASGPLYYRSLDGNLVLGSNLADLAAATAEPRVERDLLPTFFLHGCVPGRGTLVADCFRVLPGELILWERGRLQRQRLRETPEPSTASLPIGAMLNRVLEDVVTVYGKPATLLSGGPASAALQAAYNDAARLELLPTSYSAALDSPAGWAATEEAMLASRALGTEHHLVPAEAALATALPDLLAASGEPTLTSPALLLGLLAPTIGKAGFRAAMAGLGAGEADPPASAAPSLLQRGLYTLSRWVGLGPQPPLAGDGTDRDTVRLCFGEAGLCEAESSPPDLLDTAALATAFCNGHGFDLVCPYLDSRLIDRAAPAARPGRAPWPLEWLSPGGLLRPLVEAVGPHEFLDAEQHERLLREPTPFLFHLLAYDLWHRGVIDAAAARSARRTRSEPTAA